jgi:nitroreductase
VGFTNKEIIRAIHKSQHCQRNWDLSREIPDHDLDVIINAITQCPSKQNLAFYRVHLIMNRDLIEKLHDLTNGFTVSYSPYQTTTNSQALANLVVVFEQVPPDAKGKYVTRNEQTLDLAQAESPTQQDSQFFLTRDQSMAVGVAAGYANLAATLLGYATGCCSCFDYDQVKALLNLENMPALLMGIGFANENVGRRVHHLDHDFVFPTKHKQPIQVNIVK